MTFPMVAMAMAAVVLGLPFGRLRAGAKRRSSRWFACLVAPIVFVVAWRGAVGLSWGQSWPLLAVSLGGQVLGRRWGRGEAPPSGSRWRTAVYATLLAALLLVLGRPVHAHDHGPAKAFERLAIDEPAPPFTLVDQEGRTVSLDDFRGRAVAMTFLYTHCTGICPLLLSTMVAAENMLAPEERARVRFLGLTVDPARDTSARLKTFMAERGLSAERWHLLTGATEQVARVVADYGVVVRPAPQGDFVHNSVFVIIDGTGRERAELHGTATPADVLAAEIRSVLQ